LITPFFEFDLNGKNGQKRRKTDRKRAKTDKKRKRQAMSESNGRDRGGRFAVGNQGGPGRPRREVERAYVDASIGAVTIDAWMEVVTRAVNDARDGNGPARAWLSKLLGIDAPRKVTHTDADGEPLTLGAVLSVAQTATAPPRPDPEPRPNVINVEAEIARLEGEQKR
jgi:hypothetical protein